MAFIFNPFSGNLDSSPSTKKGNSAYTTYNANSSDYTKYEYVNNNFLPLSGGVISANTNTDALRITQTGLGNALLVEDSTNPDATPFLINTVGTIVMGASAASATSLSRKGVQFVSNTHLPSRIIELRNHATTQVGPGLDFNAQVDFVRTRSGNSNDYSSSFPLSAYDALGGITFKGGNTTGTSIYCQNKYNSFSGNVSGSKLIVSNHVASTNALYSILTLDENKVGIGTLTPNEALTVVGNVSSTGVVYASGGNSDQWNSAYSTVQSNSADYWNYQGTDLKGLSSGWVGGNDAYTNLFANSAAYLSSVDLSFLSVSANWNSVYTTYNKNSATYATIEFSNNKFLPLSGGTITGDLIVDNTLQVGDGNPNFDFIITDEGNVGINTETPNEKLTVVGNISCTGFLYGDGSKLTGIVAGDTIATTLVRTNSANWDSVYTTVQTNSATEWDNTLANSYTHTNFLPLTGGIISANSSTNALTVVGNISATQDYFSGSNKSVFTPQTNTIGVSAVSNIVVVSVLPVTPDPSTLYIII
jgi:hypothetical protein